jgi:Zn-dependent protease with chaperone function
VSRDLVLGALVLILCGSLACLAGLAPRGRTTRERALSGAARERRAWRRLWAPLAPAALALALLVGWAMHEPSVTDEVLMPAALALAAPLALVWLRAVARAAHALAAAARVDAPAAAVGLLRPRVIVDAGFRARLDAGALEAVLAHERAHARHRDPLRIWLAQLATDLLGPLGSARARLASWLDALEVARDDEARRAGARGEDLAHALVLAARAPGPPSPRAVATLGSPAARLEARVERLLRPLDGDDAQVPAPRWLALAALAAAAAALVGWTHGDLVVRALPFVVS